MINLPFLDAKVIFLLALCVSLSVNHLSICFNRFSIEFPVFFFVENFTESFSLETPSEKKARQNGVEDSGAEK